jgi:hypothetical protein
LKANLPVQPICQVSLAFFYRNQNKNINMKKQIKTTPVVFTPQSTGVSEILDDLVNSLANLDNLKLKQPKGK